VFPSAGFDFEADALCRLEGVTRQGLKGQRGASLPECGGDGLLAHWRWFTDTPDTAVGKPAPVREQGVDITGEGDML